MVDVEAWFDVLRDEPLIVRTPTELDAVVDAVAEWNGRIIIDLYVAEDKTRPNLNVGVNGETRRGALYYADDAGAWFSTGGAEPGGERTETIQYYYMNNSTEFPGDCEVQLDAVRRAAHEYMTTGGERPTSVTWQPAPDQW